MKINRIVEFQGTLEDKQRNYATHIFDDGIYGDDPRCVGCDCRPWGRYAEYPCGTEVPREEVEV